MSKSKLLLDEKPLMVLPKLAVLVGLNEAIVLQQVHYWLVIYKDAEAKLPEDERKHYHNGRWWVYNTVVEWQENFPWWSPSTIRRTLDSLRTATEDRPALLKTENYHETAYDRTLWYTIDYEA